jgi:hypothetical protein
MFVLVHFLNMMNINRKMFWLNKARLGGGESATNYRGLVVRNGPGGYVANIFFYFSVVSDVTGARGGSLRCTA